MAERAPLLKRIDNGEFIISVQIDPPSIPSADELRQNADQLMRTGVTLVDINSSRRFSYDSIHVATTLAQVGFEVIPHVTTRESSISGLMNQVIAAYALNDVKNYLVITGDPHDQSQAVFASHGIFQTDSVGALSVFHSYLRGSRLGLSITLGAAINQNASNLSLEGERVKAKEEVGADFFMSQPVFDKEQVRELVHFHHEYSTKPLIIGVWPLLHLRTIENIRRDRVVGVVIPDGVYEETLSFRDDELKLRKWGLQKAGDLVDLLSNNREVQGVYIVAPLRNPLQLTDLLTRILS